MRLHGTGLEFRMELAADKPGMVLQLHDFHQALVRGKAAVDKAFFLKEVLEGVVEFIAVAVALLHVFRLVGLKGLCIGHDSAGIGAKAHGAALVAALVAAGHMAGVHVVPFGHKVNDLVGRVLVKFLGIGVL